LGLFFKGRKPEIFVILYTLLPATIGLLWLMACLGASHTVTLTLSPLETHINHAMRTELLLNAPSNSAPAGLQWIFKLPPGLKIIGIEAGTAVNGAGKTLVCKGAKCLVYGMNHTTISNGPVAVLMIRVDQALASGKRSVEYEAVGRSRLRRPEIQIGDAVAVSVEGRSIAVVAGDGIAVPLTIP